MDDLNDLKSAVDSYLGLIFKIGLLVVMFASFFLFVNLTTEIFDTPKFLVLTIFTGIMLILLSLKYTLSGKVTFVRTPLDIPLLLLLTVGIVSTILSPALYVSLLGNQLKINGSLVSLVVFVLLYFVLTNSLKNVRNIRTIFMPLLWGAQLLALITLLSYAGVKILPASWNAAANFTPTGSSFTTSAILALLIPFVVTQILSNSKLAVKILSAIFLTIMGITIALTGTWASWIGALIGLILTFFVSNLRDLGNLKNLKPIPLISLIVSLTLILLVTVLSFIPPIGTAKNLIYTQSRNFPREIQLPFVTSWKISVSAFRDSPFWGTGPGTYAFDFTNYKPIEFNSTKIWNLRFDQSFNEYLQVLATLGGIGLLALLSLTALFVSSAFSVIARSAATWQSFLNQDSHGVEGSTPRNDNLKLALAISGLVFFIILALHASSLSLWILGILILASYMVVSQQNNPGLFSFKPGLNGFKTAFQRIATLPFIETSTETIRIDTLPGILLTISIALVLFASFFGGKVVLADYHHRLALNAVSQNQGIVAYNELIAAEKLNPQNDLYRSDLAQVNLALANAIAVAKAPTEASPAGSLTDQDKQNIQVLLSQSINEGRTAVTLSPRSAINWEILGLLYRQIAGVAQNALLFSLDSYGRAIQQDPLNPQLRVNVGGVYYAVQSYDMAIRFFTDAINLKPDFANGYYNLSVALRDKGDLQNAQALAEKIINDKLVDPASPDYKTVQDYLADLKAKAAASIPAQPPAATASGALQEESLPKVIELPQPEEIATPEAIEKPSPTPTPNP